VIAQHSGKSITAPPTFARLIEDGQCDGVRAGACLQADEGLAVALGCIPTLAEPVAAPAHELDDETTDQYQAGSSQVAGHALDTGRWP